MKLIRGKRVITWKCANRRLVNVASDVTFPEPRATLRLRKEVAAFRLVAAVVTVSRSIANVEHLDAEAIAASPMFSSG